VSDDKPTDSSRVEYLLAEIVDSFEKLDIVVTLHRCDSAQDASGLASRLALPFPAVVDALSSLAAAGLVRRARYDTASWVLDVDSSWGLSIEILSALYDDHRDGLLRLMARCAYDLIRARGGELGATGDQITPKKP
jgi:hypothetical protein